MSQHLLREVPILHSSKKDFWNIKQGMDTGNTVLIFVIKATKADTIFLILILMYIWFCCATFRLQ